MTPSSGLFTFLERLSRIQEKSLLTVYQFIIKGYGKGYRGTSSWKDCIGQGVWEGVQNFLCQFRGASSPALTGIHQPGSSPNSYFGVLWSLHHVNMISY